MTPHRGLSNRHLFRKALRMAIITAVLVLCSGIVEVAIAIIGRPATPMSYAGVARRTVRRGVYY